MGEIEKIEEMEETMQRYAGNALRKFGPRKTKQQRLRGTELGSGLNLLHHQLVQHSQEGFPKPKCPLRVEKLLLRAAS